MLNIQVLAFAANGTVEGGKLKKELLLLYLEDWECKKIQKLKDGNEMTALEYIAWFINLNCYLSYTGSSPV